jgi:hypothetical protein
VITLVQLSQFLDGIDSAKTRKDQPTNVDLPASYETAGSLCPIPRDVPQLPHNFYPRDAALEAVIGSLLQEDIGTVSLAASVEG